MQTRTTAPVVIAITAGSLAITAFSLTAAFRAKKSLDAYESRYAVSDPESTDVQILSGKEKASSSKASLNGKVVDSRVGLPVEGARVTLETHAVETYSDLEGRFSFERLSASGECALFTIGVKKAGFGSLRVVGEALHPTGRSITLLLGTADREEVVSPAGPQRRAKVLCSDRG